MKEIFVFGSNLSGIHGAGSAKQAYMYHGAVRGQGEGLQGDSYALPTKGYNITFMPIGDVAQYVEKFLRFASARPELQFKVTRVGCGLAKLDDGTMSSLFKNAPDNCYFDEKWHSYLGDSHNYWGTYP